ncbi:predicted protein [Streptomyces azureus]|uniref:Uncharacterized protein n=1 Tax=Streptomyces azureus TaxID=146537 RepID=A0A0K8PSM0_STRAJ|nr:predicted protein [Streptomyces azureus]
MGVGHGGLVGQVMLPAIATASVPSGPVEAYAQEWATATPAGAPTSAQVSVATAKAFAARAD